jgi:hypothetical protein
VLNVLERGDTVLAQRIRGRKISESQTERDKGEKGLSEIICLKKNNLQKIQP